MRSGKVARICLLSYICLRKKIGKRTASLNLVCACYPLVRTHVAKLSPVPVPFTVLGTVLS